MKKLKELLGEDLYNQVEAKLGTEKKYFFGEGDFVPKSRLDEVLKQVNDLKAVIAERDNQLSELSKKAKGHDELTKQIEELKAANKKATEEYEAKLLAREREYALENYLNSVGSRNNKALSALLDHEKIQYVDGKFIGLEEQIKSIKESDPYLFKSEVPTAPTAVGSYVRGPGLGPVPPKQGQMATKKWNRIHHSF